MIINSKITSQRDKFSFLPLSLQRRYSPGWASASFKSFFHPSRFRGLFSNFYTPLHLPNAAWVSLWGLPEHYKVKIRRRINIKFQFTRFSQHPTSNTAKLTVIKMTKESEFKVGQIVQKSVMKGRGCKKDTH